MNMKSNAKVLRELRLTLYATPRLAAISNHLDVETHKQRMIELLEEQQEHIKLAMRVIAIHGHEVEKGQSLQDITEFYFIEKDRFGELYKLNEDILNGQVENIKEGTILKLPLSWFNSLNIRKYITA